MELTIQKSDIAHDLREIAAEVESRAATVAGAVGDRLSNVNVPELASHVPDAVAERLPDAITERLHIEAQRPRRGSKLLTMALLGAAGAAAAVVVVRMRKANAAAAVRSAHETYPRDPRVTSEPTANPVPEATDPLVPDPTVANEASWRSRG